MQRSEARAIPYERRAVTRQDALARKPSDDGRRRELRDVGARLDPPPELLEGIGEHRTRGEAKQETDADDERWPRLDRRVRRRGRVDDLWLERVAGGD